MTLFPKKRFLILTLLMSFSTIILSNQISKSILTENDIEQLVNEITENLSKYYVSVEIANEINTVIENNQRSGIYYSIKDPNKLAIKLQADLRSINNDIHLSVSYTDKKPTKIVTDNVKSKQISKYGIWTNFGIQALQVLDGNVGYININHFGRWRFHKEHREAISAAINFLHHSDALIIDVRENQGGYEDIVAYLISYFYNGEAIHLSDYYTRYNGKTTSLYTKTDIPGVRMADVPIYILTSGNTTSAGESLAYMMKHLKRATVIGEKTAGAGHGATHIPISSGFTVVVSSEETINAITKTSFESVGVFPDVKISANKALDHAYLMALDHLRVNNTRNITTDNYDRLKLMLPPKQVVGNLPLVQYVGKYISEGIEINVFIENETLYAQVKGKGTVEFIAIGDHVFIVKMANERLKFVVTADHQVTGLIGIDSPMDLKRVDTEKE